MAEQIRPCGPRDAEAVASLIDELNEALGEPAGVGRAQVAEQLSRMAEHPEIYRSYLVEKDGRPVGYLSLLFYRSVWHRRGTAQINELVVAKADRNSGIGSRLLAKAIAEARDAGMDEIEVGLERSNTDAKRFYARHGLGEEYLLLGMEFPAPKDRKEVAEKQAVPPSAPASAPADR